MNSMLLLMHKSTFYDYCLVQSVNYYEKLEVEIGIKL